MLNYDFNKTKEYKEYAETIKKSKEPNKDKRLPGQRPRTVKCPLCGTEFAIASWKIHIKSCRQKEIKSNEYRKKNMFFSICYIFIIIYYYRNYLYL